MKRLFTMGLVLLSCGWIHAQAPLITDNLMIPKKDLAVGLFYGKDSWTKYWEGSLKRENGNIGKLTTQYGLVVAAYGVSEKVSVLAMLPYVVTKASQGTLHGMQGLQDLTLVGKYNFFKKDFEKSALKFMAVGMVAFPVSDYTADFLPMSIGMGCVNISGRLTGDYSYQKWFVTASGAYTWRSNITLDRPSYYTNGHLYNTDEVQMPNMFDFIVRMGYKTETWHVDAFYLQQNTLGGGDIERQNMPFVSNQMNFIKVGLSARASVPHVKNLAARLWGDYALTGRNVGQSTSIMGGLMYRFGPASTQN